MRMWSDQISPQHRLPTTGTGPVPYHCVWDRVPTASPGARTTEELLVYVIALKYYKTHKTLLSYCFSVQRINRMSFGLQGLYFSYEPSYEFGAKHIFSLNINGKRNIYASLNTLYVTLIFKRSRLPILNIFARKLVIEVKTTCRAYHVEYSILKVNLVGLFLFITIWIQKLSFINLVHVLWKFLKNCVGLILHSTVV